MKKNKNRKIKHQMGTNNDQRGCVRNACSDLMITSLLQFVNRLDAISLPRLFIYKLVASCFKSANIKSHKV